MGHEWLNDNGVITIKQPPPNLPHFQKKMGEQNDVYEWKANEKAFGGRKYWGI
jgi:hypothetical protein